MIFKSFFYKAANFQARGPEKLQIDSLHGLTLIVANDNNYY